MRVAGFSFVDLRKDDTTALAHLTDAQFEEANLELSSSAARKGMEHTMNEKNEKTAIPYLLVAPAILEWQCA
jgi:hypothetical protein